VAQTNRILALDVFRGITITFMILVNTPGSWSHVYPPLLHAKWHGVTPTDLVFPFFLFIVGVSMFLSFSKYGQTINAKTLNKILIRVFLIFLIGLALNYFPFYNRALADLRILGVLQRIALAYGLGAFICLAVTHKNLWKVGLLILIGYWGLLYFFSGENPYSLENNLAKTIDLAILGEHHIYKGFGDFFDPEGFLSTIPAAVTVIIGYLMGHTIKNNSDHGILVKNLLVVGTLSIFVGLIWDIYFPLNKPLWSSSYVIYTAGIASLVLGILIEVIDIHGYIRWTQPFVIFGMNPLIIYVFSIVWVKIMLYIVKWETAAGGSVNLYSWLYREVFATLFPGNLKFASFLFALSVIFLCWLFGLFLYRKKIYIKV